MDDFRDMKTDETDDPEGIKNENHVEEEKVQPCSASKVDRQFSYTKADTVEKDVQKPNQEKKESNTGITCVQEAEAEGDEMKLKKTGDGKVEIPSLATAEDGDEPTDNHIKVDKTVDYEEGGTDNQPIDFKGSQTVDEGLHDGESDIRTFKTEEDAGEEVVLPAHQELRERKDNCVNTRVIFKVSNIRSHSKNTDPLKKMIDSLPSEVVKKSVGESMTFGRGEKIDVYLHDLLSSRKHLELKVVSRGRGFAAEITNISETKVVKLNGTREVHPKQTIALENNDQLTVGCFTFLVEIAQGDYQSLQYEVKFVNIVSVDPHVAQSTDNRVLYAGQMPPRVGAPLPYGYNQPQPDYYEGFQRQGQFPYYMHAVPPRFPAEPPQLPFMPRNAMPGYYQMPGQQYQNPYYLGQQMADMSFNHRRMPEEHDDRYETQATQAKSKF